VNSCLWHASAQGVRTSQRLRSSQQRSGAAAGLFMTVAASAHRCAYAPVSGGRKRFGGVLNRSEGLAGTYRDAMNSSTGIAASVS
jgi:hypothetical protein